MNGMQRTGPRTTDPGGDSNSRALDRYEDEGGPGPDDTRGQQREEPAPAPTADRDAADPGRVILTPGSAAEAFLAHHRDIPELSADGATPREAAANLAQDLAREIEGVADHYRRGLFGRALDDVRAFLAQNP
jgi:hypothetical protein